MDMNTVPWGRWRVPGGAGPSMAVTAAQSIVTHGLTWARPATQESSPANERSPLTKPLPLRASSTLARRDSVRALSS